MTPTRTKQLKGRHVLLYLFAFFGLMFSVNGVFLYAAIDSFPGEDTPKSYLQGLNYNKTLIQRADQERLGWKAAIGLSGDNLVFEIETDEGKPLSGYYVDAVLRRPATTSADMGVILEPSAAGRYSANIKPLAMGQWQATVTMRAEQDSPAMFIAEKVLIVP